MCAQKERKFNTEDEALDFLEFLCELFVIKRRNESRANNCNRLFVCLNAASFGR